MKLSHYIRLQNAFRLVPPFIIISILIVLHALDYTGYIFPPVYTSLSEINEEKINQCPFATVTLYNLNYTGINIQKKGEIIGGYYYYICDNQCYFVILADNKFHPNYTSLTVTAKISYNSKSLPILTSNMATKLDWTENELASMVNPMIIDETGFNPRLTMAVGILIVIVASIALGNILLLILGIFIPSVALATRHQNNLLLLPKQLHQAEEEFKNNIRYSTNGMFITDNFFISINFNQVCIVPLEQIVWAYYHSVLHRNIFFKHTITYSLRLVNDKRQIFSVGRKTKAQCNDILEHISTRYPEVMIGYSDDNQLDFMYKIKSFLSKKEEDDI